MASHDAVKTVTLTAGAALTNGQLVYASTAADRTVLVKTATVTENVLGVAAETVASGSDVPVALLQGIVEVLAGGTITHGQLCVAGAAGVVTGVANTGALLADQSAVGIALTGAASGEIFEMFAMPISAPHSA